MRHLTLIAFTVLFSLLLSPQTRPAQAGLTRRDAACAAMTCVSGCCQTMLCCQGAAKDQPVPEQSPAPSRDNLVAGETVAAGLPLLYWLPRAERRLAMGEEAQQGHALPRRSAICIQLI